MATDTKEPYKWLKKDWQAFFPAIEQAETEADVERICKAEIEGWRARGMSESSLRNPYTDTTNEAKNRLQGDKLEWVLRHLSFTSAEWTLMNAGSDETIQERHENQQFIKDPDIIVSRGTALLVSEQWPDLAAGIALCTGRRLTEVMKTAELTPKTAYSVMFKGQLKAKGEGVFEIPTLAPAADVLQAVERLRGLIDTTDMEKRAVAQKHSQAVREASHRHFADLIPTRGGIHDDLYTHISRSIYAIIAVLYYCPRNVTPMHYMATIQGHYRYLEAKTEAERRNYSSVAHYSDYAILTADDEIDGRRGIRLGMSGVELLEVFKPKPRKEKKPMTTDTAAAQEQKDPAKEGKSRPITVDGPTFSREMAFKARLGHDTHAQTVNFLLDFYEQGGSAQAGAKSVADAIRSTLHSDKDYQEFQAEEDTKEAAAILEKALTSGENLQAILVDALIKEAKFRVGLSKRHSGKDFSSMPTSQLVATKHPDAARERIRRAVVAIAAYNDAATSANDRWFINSRTVQLVAGARYPIVEEWTKAHEAEIKALNDKHQLNQRYNSKPIEGGIKAVVTIPEQPAPIQAEQVAEAEQPAEVEQSETVTE